MWRATDTHPGREVAVKVLREAFGHEPDRMARFTREAQVLASGATGGPKSAGTLEHAQPWATVLDSWCSGQADPGPHAPVSPLA